MIERFCRFVNEGLKKIFLSLVRFYQLAISPHFMPCCRFQPTCSQYAYEAISRHGLVKGTYLAARRLLKCHPFSKEGGYDPVPDTVRCPLGQKFPMFVLRRIKRVESLFTGSAAFRKTTGEDHRPRG